MEIQRAWKWLEKKKKNKFESNFKRPKFFAASPKSELLYFTFLLCGRVRWWMRWARRGKSTRKRENKSFLLFVCDDGKDDGSVDDTQWNKRRRKVVIHFSNNFKFIMETLSRSADMRRQGRPRRSTKMRSRDTPTEREMIYECIVKKETSSEESNKNNKRRMAKLRDRNVRVRLGREEQKRKNFITRFPTSLHNNIIIYRFFVNIFQTKTFLLCSNHRQTPSGSVTNSGSNFSWYFISLLPESFCTKSSKEWRHQQNISGFTVNTALLLLL